MASSGIWGHAFEGGFRTRAPSFLLCSQLSLHPSPMMRCHRPRSNRAKRLRIEIFPPLKLSQYFVTVTGNSRCILSYPCPMSPCILSSHSLPFSLSCQPQETWRRLFTLGIYIYIFGQVWFSPAQRSASKQQQIQSLKFKAEAGTAWKNSTLKQNGLALGQWLPLTPEIRTLSSTMLSWKWPSQLTLCRGWIEADILVLVRLPMGFRWQSSNCLFSSPGATYKRVMSL